mgnify:CR=1 FL=1
MQIAFSYKKTGANIVHTCFNLSDMSMSQVELHCKLHHTFEDFPLSGENGFKCPKLRQITSDKKVIIIEG